MASDMSATLQTECRDWDTTPFFPAFDGPEHRAWDAALRAGIAAALETARKTPSLSAETMAAWAAQALSWEDLSSRCGHLSTYLGMLSSADAANTAVQAELAKFASAEAELSKLSSELMRALREASDADFAAFCARPELSSAAWAWQRLRTEGRAQMPGAGCMTRSPGAWSFP